jgi:hypothetical protein
MAGYGLIGTTGKACQHRVGPVSILTRYPTGRRTFRVKRHEWELLRTSDGGWRVWRTVDAHGWAICTRRSLAATLVGAWRNRNRDPRRTI